MPQSPALVRRNGWSLGWLAVAFGVTIIVCHIESGRRRWAAASWEFALAVPGSPATWGIIALAGGLLILIGNRRHHLRMRLWGSHIVFWWFCALVFASMTALSNDWFDNPVNPLSVLAWLCMAAMYRLHIRDEKDYAQQKT